MQPGQTLVLVDGSSLAYRSFYALFMTGLRRSKDSMATWAIMGFLNSLFDVMEQRRPDGLAISFDLSAPTFRDELYAEYKATRGEMPDDLAVQWPLIKQVVEILNIPLYEVAGFEADDVIGTVARQAQQRGIKVQILTGDYDSFQLVDDAEDGIKVLVPVAKRHELLIYNRQLVFEKLGVWPEQVVDYKGFCGDTSDNIPGIRGVGPKTAQTLLSSYQTMDGVYEHIEEVKGALKQKLIDGRESAYASKHLATMRMDVPLDFDFEHCQLHMPKIEEFAQFLYEMELKQILARLPKILSKFSDDGKPPEMPASVLELQSASSGGTAGGGGKLSRSASKSGPRSSAPSAVMVIEPEIKLASGPEPRVITTAADLAELIREVERYPSVAIDLEMQGTAFNGEIAGYSLAWTPGLKLNEDRILQLGGGYSGSAWKVETAFIPLQGSGGGSDYMPGALVHERMKLLLEHPTAGLIINNSKAIANALSVYGSGTLTPHFDPMLASYIVNPDDKHSLKDMAQRLLGYSTVRASESSAGAKKQLTINFAAVDKIASGAADDARIALELARYYLDGRFDADQQYLLYEMDLPMSGVLARMEQAGMALDLPYLAGFSEELTRDLTRLEKEIYEHAGHAFNINSTLQLQTVLFDELGLKTKARTKSGSYSTDASVLESLREAHPVVAKILEYRHLSKLRSTYVDALPREVSSMDNRLHGEFNMTTTATGRLSSSNPNLQNIPIKTEIGRRIRRAFVPGESDSVLLSADYSQIELRLLGHMSADDILRDAFEKDQDIHRRTAGEIFDTPIDMVQQDQRRVGKTLNFALVYQQGAMATAQDLGISMKEAQAFIEKYFSRYPRVRGFIARTIEDAKEKGYVHTLWGRRRYFRNLNDRSDVVRKADERAAVNAPIQGSAADLMKLAMIRLDKELIKRKLKSKLILQVHDELVLEVPKEELEEAKIVVRESMLMDQPFKVPLKVDIGVGPNWMDTK